MAEVSPIRRNHSTLLVTGGAGFIGSHYVEQAVNAGKRVIVLDALTYAGHPENLAHISGPGEYHLIEGDICDAGLVRDLFSRFEFDAVLNFAAESHVDRSISGPSAFIQTNIFGTFNLLETSHHYWRDLTEKRKENFVYLQVSTDEVFGSLGATGFFSETSPVQPNSPYSASKAGADHLVRAWYETFGIPTVTTHCSNNYGARQYPEKLIPLMIRNAIDGKPLGIYGDGKNVRDWIHVKDHCAGIQLALENGNPGAIYCFGGNAERTNNEVVSVICKEMDRLLPRHDGKKHEVGIKYIEDRLGHDRRYAIDDRLAVKELGFKRSFNFEDGLKDTVSWYLNNQEWSQAVLNKNKKVKN